MQNTIIIKLLTGLALCATLACANSNTTAQLNPSDRTPAALAEIDVDRQRGTQNAQIDIALEHLPPPAELGDEYTTFVVWLTPRGSEQAQNIGQLDYDPGSREGSLDTITPYDQFDLTITAEPSADPLEQSEMVIASGDVDLRRYR